MNQIIFFLFLTIFCVLIQGFFSMFEMACVSLNKIKLHYKATTKSRKAKWLEFLLTKPSYLFGTTLICVNTLLQLGSEASRRFYEANNLDPSFAPITQILIVLIFGELSPLFAARKHSEDVAYFAVPIVYLISRILTPFIWVIDKITKASNFIFGKQKVESFLSKEELEKVLEEPTKNILKIENENFNNIVSNIFSLKDKKASEIMLPVSQIPNFSSDLSIGEIKVALKQNYSSFILVYNQLPQNIVGIAYPRDLLNALDTDKIINFIHTPWFITENVLVIDILKQFRTNKESYALVLDKSAKCKGMIALSHIEDEIFGEMTFHLEKKSNLQVIIEKTLDGKMTLKAFNKQFKTNLSFKNARTLSDLIILYLNHRPSEDEVIIFDKYEFTIIETSILGIEKVKVKAVIK
jgi:putative hemolysin